MRGLQRTVVGEALIGIGFLALTWYAYLAVVWGMMDYCPEGPLLGYVLGPGIHVEILVLSIGMGALVAAANHLMERPALRQKALGTIIALRVAFYVTGLIATAVVVHAIFLAFIFTADEIAGLWGSMSWKLAVSLGIYMFISFSALALLLEVRRKVGPGNLGALILGRYHRPREEVRTFLFLDLRSSTSIAERLGHIRYSQFIRQCFHELTEFVLEFDAQIYQFVGDEVVLTWTKGVSESGPSSMAVFFAFRDRLLERSDWYEDRFGVAPEFRGGVEVGPVTATEVGDIKREIAFHGNALNTAARLLELCSEYDAHVLISERIKESISGDPALSTDPRGEIALRGKADPVSVYSVERTEVQAA